MERNRERPAGPNPEGIGWVTLRFSSKAEAVSLLKEFWEAMGAPLREYSPDEYLEQISFVDRTSAVEEDGGWTVSINGNWSPITNRAYAWLKERDLLTDVRKAEGL
jgi:hypothetical protein